MAKLRMSQRCAGGCGRWLVVGTQVAWLHRNPWCVDCAVKHKRGCAAHDIPAAV